MPVPRAVSRSNEISRPDLVKVLTVSSMVVDEQIRPEEASSTVSGSLTVFDEQCRVEEASSPASLMGSVYTDESPGSSWVSDFSDFSASALGVDPDPGSIFVSNLALLPVGAANDGSIPLLVVPAVLEPSLSTGLVSELALMTVPGSATPAGSHCLFASTQLGFGLSKSQIWLLEWIKDRLKINEEVKDEDHLAFLKSMEEDFHWINLVVRKQGRLEVDEEDICSISMVACEEGRWEVDEEEDD